ncbi:MAG: hypothetical protein ACFFG0_49160 [Candidatus Thorarchaeota archaeon]
MYVKKIIWIFIECFYLFFCQKLILLLANKFNEIRLSDWINELSQDFRFEDKRVKLKAIKENYKITGFQKTRKTIILLIKDALKDAKDLRYVDLNGVLMYDPNFVLVGLPHYNPEQEIDVIFNQPIKDFVSDLKKSYYTISYKIRLALLKDGHLIEINEDSNEHLASWLIKNGYSVDETVYILPVDKDYYGPLYEKAYWKIGVPSPYTTHFDNFQSQLRDLVYRLCFIGENSFLATTNFLFPDNPANTRYLTDTYNSMIAGKEFAVAETSLLKMHSLLLNRLEFEYRAGQFSEGKYTEFRNEIDRLFSE